MMGPRNLGNFLVYRGYKLSLRKYTNFFEKFALWNLKRYNDDKMCCPLNHTISSSSFYIYVWSTSNSKLYNACRKMLLICIYHYLYRYRKRGKITTQKTAISWKQVDFFFLYSRVCLLDLGIKYYLNKLHCS